MRVLMMRVLMRWVAAAGLLAVVCLGACSGDEDVTSRDIEAIHDDVKALASSLAELVVVRDIAIVRTCQNSGSGPIPPTTRIDLALRDGATVQDVRDLAAELLEKMGYQVSPDDDPALFVAERELKDNRGAEVRLYASPSSSSDLVIGTALTPAVTC